MVIGHVDAGKSTKTGPCLLEYLKIITDTGSGRQRRRAVAFVDEILLAAERAGRKVGRVNDLRAMVEAVKLKSGDVPKA